MDWNLVALIGYVFALLFLLAFMVMKSYRGTKKRYAKLLEEKQQKLSRMQIDIEETMDGLESYADEVRNEWSGFRSKERESFASIQEQGLKMAAALVEVRGELNAVRAKQKELERRIEELSADRARPDLAQVTGEAAATQQAECVCMAAQQDVQADTPEREEADTPAELARRMLASGTGVAETAIALGMSRGEVELIAGKLVREKKRTSGCAR